MKGINSIKVKRNTVKQQMFSPRAHWQGLLFNEMPSVDEDTQNSSIVLVRNGQYFSVG